ncbi:MAG: DUF192 domain-containing protein [Candidatus Altiarchaeales archaeon]|nr:MAG: DUF192 domain-containing protein [Candidatus Altiarchaeales archaeon]RLI95036.1 MAG: DUF192 domain-containing protein [Candidatus Altiarchaeales archaeon]HDO82270.1 DUF192 domain-containing protein [Candidatus Altiarchaeales archaeon]HEX54919.1 DUF192 domain-containing protein [Candidatus Altiarchaeales archaeon]
MMIVNETRGFVISENSGIANSLFSRLKGLMLSERRDLVLVSPREGIRESSIHMLFMRFPIDVIWLNSDMRVVDLKSKIPPFNPFAMRTWRIYRPRKPARYVIELGGGNLGETRINDKVKFLYSNSRKSSHQPS